MGRVFEWLPCSDPARDSHRFAAAVEAAVRAGGVARRGMARRRRSAPASEIYHSTS